VTSIYWVGRQKGSCSSNQAGIQGLTTLAPGKDTRTETPSLRVNCNSKIIYCSQALNKLLAFLLHYKKVKLWLSLFTSNFLDSLQFFTLLEDGLTSFFSLIMTTTTRATTRSLLQPLTCFRRLLLFVEESLGKVFCGVSPQGNV